LSLSKGAPMKEIVKADRNIVIGQKFELGQTGLIITGNPTYEDWANCGGMLAQIEGSVHWWIGDWVNYGEMAYGEKYSQALEDTEFSEKTLWNDAWVCSRFEISRRREKLPYSYHIDVAALNQEEADRLLDQAEKEGWTRAQLRAAKKTKANLLPLPKGKYNVIYADPPWEYGDKCEDGGVQSEGVERKYPILSIEQLCGYADNKGKKIQECFAKDAVLFLWVTSPLLEECFEVIKAWGFKYKASFVWDKVKHNMGHYNSVRHEFLLICIKGSFPPQNKKLYDSVVSIERSKHSEKPEKFRKIIISMYSKGKYLELFARKKVENWVCYGDEL